MISTYITEDDNVIVIDYIFLYYSNQCDGTNETYFDAKRN